MPRDSLGKGNLDGKQIPSVPPDKIAMYNIGYLVKLEFHVMTNIFLVCPKFLS